MYLPRWLIKLIFHLLYHQMAWSYDLVAWFVSFGQWSAWRRLALPFLQPGPILELAYGTGGLFVDMLEAGHQPVGIDLSPYMARIASHRLHRHRYPVALCQARAQTLPFPSNHFSNVVATFPTDYMLQPETLAEVHRVLKEATETDPPGRLIIVFEGQLRGPWPIRPFIEWLYKITDQRSLKPTKPLLLMKKQQLKARWEIIDRKDIAAHLLIGEKNGE